MKFGLKIGLFAEQNFFRSWLPWAFEPQVKILAEHQLKLFPTSWPAAVSLVSPTPSLILSRCPWPPFPEAPLLPELSLGEAVSVQGWSRSRDGLWVVHTVCPPHLPVRAFGNTLCLPQKDSNFGFVCFWDRISFCLAGWYNSLGSPGCPWTHNNALAPVSKALKHHNKLKRILKYGNNCLLPFKKLRLMEGDSVIHWAYFPIGWLTVLFKKVQMQYIFSSIIGFLLVI